jgi:hypothetical protein
VDLFLYVRNYFECGQFDHAASEHPDLFEMDDYDHEVAGARLLARHMAAFLDQAAIQRVLNILKPEADIEGSLSLAHQSGMPLEHACRLIGAMCQELGQRRIPLHAPPSPI